MANWRPPVPKIWRFRIRGVSGDGTTVTLGRFENEQEARAEFDRLVEEGYYKKLSIKPIDPPPPVPEGAPVAAAVPPPPPAKPAAKKKS